MQDLMPSMPFATLGFLLALVLAAVIHEMGHLLMAWLLHIPIRRISIGLGPIFIRRALGTDREFVLRAFPVGMAVGVPNRRGIDGSDRRPAKHDLLMALAGPAANLMLFVALAIAPALGHFSPEVLSWFTVAAILSAFLGLANLIPLPGLDGGHMLMLVAAGVGLRLSRQREATLHRVGLRAVAVGCVLVAAARLVITI